MAFTKKIKDPQAHLDYLFDLTSWMPEDDFIVDSEVRVPAGLTKTAESHQDSAVQVWISGGTLGENYTVTANFTTDVGRIDERSFILSIQER